MARFEKILQLSTVWTIVCAFFPRTSATPTASVIGLPTVTLQGSSGEGTLTGLTIAYDEPDFLGVSTAIDAYLGVSYAVPPLGELRYKYPVPFDIVGSYNATEDRDICPQINPLGTIPEQPPEWARKASEDCLYLSIYTPSPKPIAPVPVLVWIHGGGYAIGSGSGAVFEPLPILAFADIVVVNLNYRLGVFGFLTTGDDVATGNYGMMDQVLGLQWIQKNIAAFGGDPNKVTIAGESAGGASVGQHMLSPLSRGLFHQAVMQSGNGACHWAWTTAERAAESFRGLASVVDCPTDDSRAMVECLRTVDEETLIREQILSDNSSMLTRPVVDSYFLPDDPVEMIKRRQFQVLPNLMGTNEDESAWTTMLIDLPHSLFFPPHINMSYFRYMIPQTLFDVDTEEEINAVEHQYIDWSIADNASASQLGGYVRMDTDQTFACPTEFFARALESAGADVYRYEMTHRPAWSAYAGIPKWIGAAHMEDVQFVFAWDLNPTLANFVKQTDEEKYMSIEFIRYWTNFVISGNPNEPVNHPTYPSWPRYTIQEQEYKKLSLNMTNGRAMRAADCSFWLNFMQNLHIQADAKEDVYEDWQKAYEIWRDTDMANWESEFQIYRNENSAPCASGPTSTATGP